MVDITKIQTFAIPKDIVELQELNTSLANQNTELTTKSSNLIWCIIGLLVAGGVVYYKFKKKFDEQNNVYTR